MYLYFFSLILLCLLSSNLHAQNYSEWAFENKKGQIDTIVFKSHEDFSTHKILRDSMLEVATRKVNIPRYPEMRKHLESDLDSLIKNNKYNKYDSDIRFLKMELKSIFQIIKVDSIEFALYTHDTIQINGESILLYIFSSSLKKGEWHEHNSNWMLNYAVDIGLVQCSLSCNYEYFGSECFDSFRLLKHKNLSRKKNQLLGKLTLFCNQIR